MNALDYAQRLIQFDSTWYRSNAAVSDYVEGVLRELGCETERVEYTDPDGDLKVNGIARRGLGAVGLAYFGHTDVVTSDDWAIAEHGPFEPTVRDGLLYGRGSTDMKGSIACMLAALASLGDRQLTAPLYISCSSDEEVSHGGAVEITKRSELYRELVAGGAVGIVGEPTRLDVVYAHKGGCRITATSRGRSAHSSTREGINANWAMIPFLAEIKAIYEETESNPVWLDQEFDPPSICLNLGINDHTRAVNITAPQSICTMGFRPMPATDVEGLLTRMRKAAQSSGVEMAVEILHPAYRRDPESSFVQAATKLASGRPPRTVGFGSEASNFTEVANLIVMGPGDIAQAHKSDEWISLADLERGTEVYTRFIHEYCCS